MFDSQLGTVFLMRQRPRRYRPASDAVIRVLKGFSMIDAGLETQELSSNITTVTCEGRVVRPTQFLPMTRHDLPMRSPGSGSFLLEGSNRF